ncbi:MAG: hypothetical protein ABIN25_00370 [Ginsengibacter sp.]
MENVLDQKLISYFTQLNNAEKKSILLMVKTFLAGRDGTYDVTDIEEYNKEIDEALEEIAAGNYITQEQIEKNAASW